MAQPCNALSVFLPAETLRWPFIFVFENLSRAIGNCYPYARV